MEHIQYPKLFIGLLLMIGVIFLFLNFSLIILAKQYSKMKNIFFDQKHFKQHKWTGLKSYKLIAFGSSKNSLRKTYYEYIKLGKIALYLFVSIIVLYILVFITQSPYISNVL